MKGLVFNGDELCLRTDLPDPALRSGWAVVEVDRAGICRTDLEIVQGYMGFTGVLGHEFVGRVVECGNPEWTGKRVVGEINAACGNCHFCCRGMARHCPERSVFGILNLDGCMAERCSIPVVNLRQVPDVLSDEQAVFTEPLSAAYRILEQLSLSGDERCIVLGDGKLGILCAWVLNSVCDDVTLVGRHHSKLNLARIQGLKTSLAGDEVEPGADVVVEATGRTTGFQEALRLCRPQGTVVLKSTIAAGHDLDLSPIVIHEIRIVGSRCGLFAHGLRGLEAQAFPVDRLIAGRYSLDEGVKAFEHAGRPGVLKVLLER